MVAIVTGAGLGLQRDSASILGSQGQIGSAALGQGGDRVTVNAANGNLVVQSVDEMLIGTGLDDIVTNTYNSQGTFTANGWQESFQRHTGGLTGTVNTSGSTITHYGSDGTTTVYTYNTTKGLYVGNEAGGAYDTLSYSSSTNKWTWQEGRTRIVEVYDNANSGRLMSTADADGNTLSYTYTGSQLTRITTAGGDYTSFAYTTAGYISSIATSYTDGTGLHSLKRVYYGYDASNRLTTVTVDLSPGDSSISDNKTYVTTYAYDGASNRVASITQSDGTSLQIAYILVGSAYEVASLTRAVSSTVSETTTFTYGTNMTTVTDPQGNSTTLVYDSNKRLTQLISPPAVPGGAAQLLGFSYDSNGNLLYSGTIGDPGFTNIGVNWGDLVISDSGVATTQTTEVDNGVPVYRRQTTTTPTAGAYMRLGQTGGRMPVTPGQSFTLSVYATSSGASWIKLYAMWRDASGTLLSSTAVSNLAVGGSFTGGLATASFGSGTTTAPDGAAYLEFMVQGVADGTGPLNVAIAQPTVIAAGGAVPPAFTYTYDTNGNMLTKTDGLGNQTVYVYDGNNQLLTTTIYADGSSPLTTRYVYDAENHLVFELSPHGDVTQYGYNTQGLQTSAIQYTADIYNVSGLATSASPSLTTMNAWATSASRNLTATNRTDTTYDPYRGAIASVTTYKTTNASGNGATPTTIGYVYDQAGQLLQRTLTDGTETNVYDGLFRLTSHADAYGKTTLTAYSNISTGAKAVITYANNTTRTSTYDLAGDLVSTVMSATGTSTATTTYVYDSNGNLVQVKDPVGQASYFVYDDRNRKVADVSPDGAITIYAYNTNDQIISTCICYNRLSSTQLSALAGENPGTAPISLSDIVPATSSGDRWTWNVYDADGRLIEAIDALGYATTYAYDDASQLLSTRAYATALATATVTGFKTTPPTTVVLPTADANNDRVTRYLYDDDGRVAGVLDADGYLTETRYDGAGQKTQTIAYATQTSSGHWATGSLAQLLADAGTSASDVHTWYIYDAAGRLGAEIDGEGNLNRYDTYNDMGYAQTVTCGQVLNPASLLTPPLPTLATLPAATGPIEVTTFDYDEYGHLLSKTLTLTGGASETTTYAYDSVYNLTSQATVSSSSAANTADGRAALFKYDGFGRKIASLDGDGVAALAALGASPTQAQIDAVWAAWQTTYVYDQAGRLKSQTDADGDRTVFYYDSRNRLAYRFDAAGGAVKYLYNTASQQTSVTTYANTVAPDKLALLTGGKSDSNLTNALAGLASASIYATGYDVAGNIKSATDALGVVTNYAYNAFGEVTSRTDPLATGVTTQTTKTYSRRGLLLTSTADVGAGRLNLATSYVYDAFGRVTRTTDANGIQRSTTYDRAGRTLTAVDGLSNTASFTYDGLGHVLTTTDRAGATTTYAYSLFDRQVTVTDASGIVTTTTRNAYGQTVRIVDGTGAQTTYVYDADGNLASTTDAVGNTTTQAFTAADRLAGVTSPRGIVTSYSYDPAGRTTQRVVDPSGLALATTWTYDGKGQVITVTDPNGVITTYTYDLDGQTLTEIVDSGGLNLTTTWTYDQGGRSITRTDATGTLTQSTYDAAGRLTKVIVDYGGLNITAQHAYDPNGNRISDTDAAGHVTRYVYDSENRLAFTIDPAGGVTRYSYDSEGRRLQMVGFAAVYTTAGTPSLPDMQNWVTAHASATNDTVARSTYDAVGRLAYDIDATGAVTAYTYDNDGRITATVRYNVLNTSAGDQTLGQMQAWATTNAGTSDLTNRAVYDADGQLTFGIDATGAVTRYVYDGDGNVVRTNRYATLFATTDTSFLTHMQDWDSAHTSTSNLVTWSAYDNAGRVAYSIDATGAVTRYTYDKGGRITQIVQYATLNTAPDMQHLDTWAAGHATAADRTTRSTYDAVGRLIYAVDAAGDVTGHVYDAGGRVTRTVQYKALYTNPAVDIPTWVASNANATNDRAIYAAYDAAGRMIYAADAAGAVTGYNFDANGNVTRTTSYGVLYTNPAIDLTTWANTPANAAGAQATQSIYDAAGRIAYAIDEAGAVTAYTYNAFGWATKTVQYAQIWNSSWNPGDPLNMPSWVSSHADAGNDRTTTYTYDHDGHLTYVTDPAGITSRYNYDSFGRQIYFYAAYGTNDLAKTRWSYNGNNQVISLYTAYQVTGEQTLVKYTYDAFGRKLTFTDADNNQVKYTYDKDDHLLTTLTAANGAVNVNAKTTNQYDTFGDLVKVTDPLGNAGYFYYDAAGRQTWQVDAEGYATQTAYDFGQVKSVTRYAARATGYTVGTPPTVTANAGADNTTSFTRDKADRVLTTTDGNGYVTTYTYDAFGNRLTVKNALNATVTYTYDARGLMVTQVTPAGMDGSATIAPSSTTTYAYDAFGNRTQMIEAAGAPEQRTTTYVYDKDDRLTRQTGDAVTTTVVDPIAGSVTTNASVTPTQAFTYDLRGNQTSSTDANNAVTYTYYDHNDRKIAQVDALGYITTFTYDLNGNLLSQTAYATALSSTVLSGLSAGGTPPAPPASNGGDRITTFAYDKDNQQISASILGVETGAWDGAAWTPSGVTALTTQTAYDFDGNAVQQTDANGNSTYAYYDKLGRKIAEIDAGGYMTAYILDAEGNVTSQTQYATALAGPFTAGGTPPSAPSASPDDRTTTFTYDHDGQRLTETRAGLTYATVNGNNLTTTTGSVTITYGYNGLGQVTKKIEATGDETDYAYDNLGRLARVITAVGKANAMTTQTTYDRLGNVLTTIAGYGSSTTETTTYTYGAGGRLATQKDATNFIITYGYDANGRTTFQSYVRAKSGGTTVQEAEGTTYDALGQVLSTFKMVKPASNWVMGDTTTDAYYNAFGEVVARGTNTGGNILKTQEFADYDNAGRIWHGNMNDGVSKVYGYDANGNQTLELQSLGSTDLRNIANLDAARGASGIIETINVYDSRGQLIKTERPTNANLDGTITSISTLSIQPVAATATEESVSTGANSVQSTFKVRMSDSSITSGSGKGSIQVVVTSTNIANSNDVTTRYGTFAPGSGYCGAYTFSCSAPSGPPVVYQVEVKVTQNDANGTPVTLLDSHFAMVSNQATAASDSNTFGSSLHIQSVNPLATALKMYVRPSGSSGGYTLVNAVPAYDGTGLALAGGFSYDTGQAPFNATSGSSWEIRYLATDANGNVVDAKAGSVTFNSSSPPQPSVGTFTAVPVFTAAQVSGSWQLTTSPLPSAYAETRQAFNAFGDVVSQTDAMGNATTFTYDALGDLKGKQNPTVMVVGEDGVGHQVATTETYYYDKSGRLVGHVDANGNRTTQSLLAGTGYDGTDALTTAQYNPDGGTVTTAYDVFGNATAETDGIGKVTANTYDKDNRLLTVTHPDRGSDVYSVGVSKLIDTYAYDGLGQRISHTNNVYGGGVAETTDYDIDGRIIQTTTFGGQTASYNYSWTAMTATGRVSAGQEDSGTGLGTAGYWTTTTSQSSGKTSSVTTDTFGKLLTSSDFGAHTTSLAYNKAGQVTHQGGSTGQSIDYSYTATGLVAGAVDNSANGLRYLYAYDDNGNRTLETSFTTGASPVYYQNEGVTYDALNRVVEVRDVKSDITYAYDANGNRREIKTIYPVLNAGSGSQDYWYKYDSMNRFVLTRGTLSGSAIVAGASSETITYNARGDRMTATIGSDGHVETYGYSADGYLETVKINNVLGAARVNDVLGAARVNDVLGRMTGYTEYQSNGTTVLSTRAITYDRDNRVTAETDQTINGSTTYTSQITNDYRLWNGTAYTGADQGVLIHAQNVQTQSGVSGSVTTTTVYGYVWWNQAKQNTVTVSGVDTNNPNSNQWASGNTNYTYDANGNLATAVDGATNGVDRTIAYVTNTLGQVLLRAETDNGQAGVKRQFFYLNGRQIGNAGDDGDILSWQLDDQTDYGKQLADDRVGVTQAGMVINANSATPMVLQNAYFDTFEPYDEASVSQSGSSYTVVDGDSLPSIALTLWGDPSLWYVLAEANGLDAGATLTAGMLLTVPGNVTVMHNNSGTYQAYDPANALGNTTPTLPREPQPPAPRQQGCGMVGDIIAIAVSLMVTVYTWGALSGAIGPVLAGAGAVATGDVAYQGVEIAAGNQSKFNWKELGAAALEGMVEGPLGLVGSNPAKDITNKVGFLTTVWHAVETSAIHQSANIAVDNQKKFDWTALAVSSVEAGAAWGMSSWLNNGHASTTGKPIPSDTARGRILVGAAQVIAGAVTKSVITGQDIGKSAREALPGVIGSTIGQAFVDYYHIGEQKNPEGLQKAKADLRRMAEKSNANKQVLNDAYTTDANENSDMVLPEDAPQITYPKYLGQIDEKVLPLIPGETVKATDGWDGWEPVTDAHILEVNGTGTFLLTDDVFKTVDQYGQPAYKRAGPSGTDGTYQVGDLYYNRINKGYYPLSDLDADIVNDEIRNPRPDEIVAAHWSIMTPITAFIRTTANEFSGSLPDYMEAISSSHDEHSFRSNLERQKLYDLEYSQAAPVTNGLAKAIGAGGQILLTPELIELRASSAAGGRLALSELDTAGSVLTHTVDAAKVAEIVPAGTIVDGAQAMALPSTLVEGEISLAGNVPLSDTLVKENALAAKGALPEVAEVDLNALAKAGRTGKQARLRELANDPLVSSADRGWIQQEMNSIERGQRSNIRVPQGKVLAHRRGFEAKNGYSYKYSELQNVDLHKLQHKYEGY